MRSPVAVGIDLVEVGRFARALERCPRLEARVFTEGERAVCRRRAAAAVERFAARFAAKEAAFKALGEGWPRVRHRDVEVVTGDRGEPSLRLHGRAAELLGRRVAALSLSHAGGFAAAHVVVVNGEGTR